MVRFKVVAVTFLITMGAVLLVEHPDILTAGASAKWVSGGAHLNVTSYALDVVYVLSGALGVIVTCMDIRRRIRQRTAWKRRYSMKATDKGRPSSSDNELENGR